MNRVIIYHFIIQADSPIYFGDSEQGELVLNAQQQPIVLGNTIGGALREYLQRVAVSEEMILQGLGGEKENQFHESLIYISDGQITAPAQQVKEGTAVDPEYGTAKDKHKYTLYYLPEGTEIHFRIECGQLPDSDSEQEFSANEFEKWIGTWAEGFNKQRLLLGGQKSNGFGQFKLKELRKTEFPLDTLKAMDRYIFHKDSETGVPVMWESLNRYNLQKQRKISFSMAGCFPYGVYQSFPLKSPLSHQMTGLQKKQNQYFIPASSIKGLIKSEVRLFIRRMLQDGPWEADELDRKVEEKCSEWFGSTDRRGKLIFTDLKLENARHVEIKRCLKNEEEPEKHPIYVKIDRLTGGAYASALKHQQEIQGEAELRFDLFIDETDIAPCPFIFPLIYVLRRIGTGQVPLGGRTVIGLGRFAAEIIRIEESGDSYEIEAGQILSEQSRGRLEQQLENFKGWCGI